MRADLSTEDGVLSLWHAVGEREVDYLMANAGVTLGHRFIEEEWPRVQELVGLNVVGTTLLLHRALSRMAVRGQGRVLVTGSIAGFMPGSFQAAYQASKAYLNSLSFALNDEMKETGVTVTCLMPGITDTDVFARGDMENTPAAQSPIKSDPADVARAGYEAMKAGRAGMTPGLVNKVITAFAGVLPEAMLARMNRFLAEPADEKA